MGSALESYVNPLHFRFRVEAEATFDPRSSIMLHYGFIKWVVSIITADGRNFVGTLKGFDQTINIILDESQERVYNPNQGVEQITLGLHIIRGDNIAVIGELDEEVDARLDFSAIKAEALNPIVH